MNRTRPSRSRRGPLTLTLVAFSIAAMASLAVASAASLNVLERIDLNVTEAGVDRLFQLFGQLTHARLEIDPHLQAASRRVSIRIDNVTIQTALTAICESIGCRWHTRDDVIVVTALPAQEAKPSGLDAKIDLRVDDAPLREIMQTMAMVLGAELTFDEALAGAKLSIDLGHQAVAATLDAACARAGCKWKLTTAGPRPSLQVTAR